MMSLRQFRMICVVAALATAWAAALAIPPLVLLQHRTRWLEELDRPEAQAQWDEFREAMRAQTGRQGPVQHKVPKSPEPPLRVWLRDYVWLGIAAWLVLGGTLGLCTIMLVCGAAAKRATGRWSPAEDQPRRDGDDEKQHERDAEDAEQRGHGKGPPREA